VSVFLPLLSGMQNALQWNLNFLDIFSKNSQISIFLKLRPVGGELFHAVRLNEPHSHSRLFGQRN
jgi:hypothetical protein